jgi:hypothetical protein
MTCCALSCITLGCGSRSELKVLRGAATIDGNPIDSGTIHFVPKENSKSRGIGGQIANGAFDLRAGSGTPYGEYTVSLQAFKNTGKIVNDPQRGRIPEKAPINAADSPKSVTVSTDNSSHLELSFFSSRPR